MSLFEKSDVKNHVHSPFLTRIHLVQPESQADATGFSGAEPDAIKAGPLDSGQDSAGILSSSSGSLPSTDPVTDSIHSQAPTVLKSAQE